MNQTEFQADSKVIFVGDSAVGKTCLMNAMVSDGKYDKNTKPTLTPSHTTLTYKKVDGTQKSLQLWDTAGQERYQAVSVLFFRSADVAVVCFIACDDLSKDNAQNWVRLVKEQSPQCKIIFAATKQDLLTQCDTQQMMTDMDADFKKYDPSGVYLTSSKTGFGTQELLAAVAEAAEAHSVNSVAISEMDKTDEKNNQCC